MTLDKLLSAMKARTPWHVANKILAECGFPCGHGWDKTFEKLKHFKADADQLKDLLERYEEHIVSGEKSVRFYELTKKQMKQLREALEEVTIQKSDFSKAYPLPIDEEKLDGLSPSKPKLVHIEHWEDGIAAVYSSIRVAEVRVSLEPDDVPNAPAHLFEDFSEIIGIQTLKTQSFDVVWVPHDGTTIDIRVDSPLGVTQDAMAFAHGGVQKELAKLLEQESFASPVNLFPLIEKIYRTADEGTVVELAFGTTTASLKHEKMRRRRQCLRTEVYHLGGTKAVQGEIEPFKLGVEWAGPLRGPRRSYPELILHGTSRMLHDPNPTLTEVTIRKCTGIHDFEFVRAKIETHLHELQADDEAA